MTSAEQQRHKEIEQRCQGGESLRKIQRDYPVSLGTLGRVRDGHVVQDVKLRVALKLPAYRQVEACWCGDVHAKQCQRPFADRIPSDEPQREEILGLYELMRGEQ